MRINQQINKLSTKELCLDRKNPRLAEHVIGPRTPEKEIIALLWEVMDVQELVQSIVASGYFEHEPLIVVQEQGKYIVIEGNRRLAAVKVLLDRHLAEQVGCQIRIKDPKAREALKALPAILSQREDSWRYLGFKHINGPAKWSSYAKAQYIANIHREYQVPLADIAEQIGDRHKTVQRLYRGLMVIEQAEEAQVFSRENRYRTRFAFSHLYTGLDYDGIKGFLSLSSSNEEHARPVLEDAVEKLGELCVWLYGNKQDDVQPVIQSQNPDLRYLDAVLKNNESVAALRKGVPLIKALEIGREPAAVLEELLLEAKRTLQQASGYITTGFKESKTTLGIADDIYDLADDICDQLERKMRRSVDKNRRRENRQQQDD